MESLINFLRVQFYKVAAVQPTYLLKKELLQENFNNYAKILATPILYGGTT